MANINPLPVFSQNGEKNTTGLNQADGFPAALKPARQWFNFFFNAVTTKINELAAAVDALSSATQPDATEAVKGVVQLATEAETVAGTSDLLATHPKGVRDLVNAYLATGELQNNGYIDLPMLSNQFSVRWGEQIASNGGRCTFTEPFENAVFVVIACQGRSTGSLYKVSTGSEDLTGFTAYHEHSADIAISYIAIGR